MQPICKIIIEGVNVGSRLAAVEGHPTLCAVQEHPHPPGPVIQSQIGDRRAVGLILTAAFEAQSPEAVVGANCELALSVYGLSDNTQTPLDLLAHLHLPVVPPAAEALLGQNVGHTVETFGVFRNLLKLVRVPDLLPVIGHRKRRVCGFGAQTDVHYNRRFRENYSSIVYYIIAKKWRKVQVNFICF